MNRPNDRDPFPSNEEPSISNNGLRYHYFCPQSASTSGKATQKSAKPAVLFCNGFRSSMNGNKARFLEAHCQCNDIPYCRFDYRGHGQSDPESFLERTLSDWIHDAESILEEVLLSKSHERVLLVGSSMGSWIAFHLALKYPDKVAGIVGIASAVDFTQHSLYDKATDAQKAEWRTKYVAYFPSEYESDPYPISWCLVEDAQEKWLLLMGDSTS